MTDSSDKLSENSEAFIVNAEKGPSEEIDKKLLEIIDQGLNPDYIRYYDGYQRMDDGYRWGNAYYFLTFVLDNCSLKVMKKLFEKYPDLLYQTVTTTRSTHRGYSDAYWVRGLNDGNGENPVVKNSEIAAYLIEKLPDRNTRCLKNAFAKLSLDDCMKLLENPDVSGEKKSVLLHSRDFKLDSKEALLSLRPYADRISNVTFDLKELTTQEVLSFLSGKQDLEKIAFLNFPTAKKDQEPIVQKLADMRDDLGFRYGSSYATDKDGKNIDLWALVKKERQDRVERANAGKADWKVDFLKKCAVKDFKSALAILQKEGLLSERITTSKSSFGREFDLSPLGWGNNSLEVHDDLVAVDIKDMGDDTFAIGRIYEDRKWRSTVGYHSGIGWWWSGDVAVVNLDKGLGPVAKTSQICVRHPTDVTRDIFGNIRREDFVSVNGNTASISLGGYTSAMVNVPEPENMSSRLGKASQAPRSVSKKTTKIIKGKEPPVNG